MSFHKNCWPVGTDLVPIPLAFLSSAISGCQSNKVQVKAVEMLLSSLLSLNNSIPECRQRLVTLNARQILLFFLFSSLSLSF